MGLLCSIKTDFNGDGLTFSDSCHSNMDILIAINPNYCIKSLVKG